jgi:hypothetical protein
VRPRRLQSVAGRSPRYVHISALPASFPRSLFARRERESITGRGTSARVLRLAEIEPISVAGINWLRVRQPLGVTAFGINAYRADAGEQLIEPHDETGSGAGRHEELYVVIAGHARFTIAGAEHDAPAGTFVFLPDPESRRSATALVDGTAAVAVGGRVGEPYVVAPWEPSFAAKGLADAGDPGAAADVMADALAEYAGDAHVLYNTACFEALAGRREAALAHLNAAVKAAPQTREWAAKDADFDSIRDDPAFPA